GVRFTCEAMITNVNPNRSWSYSSCSQCTKASTKRSGIYFGESTKKGAGRFVVNDILDIELAGAKLAPTSALTLDQPDKRHEVPDTQIAISSSPVMKESGSKNNDMPGITLMYPCDSKKNIFLWAMYPLTSVTDVLYLQSPIL
ncbi:hypothetical protein Tco_0901541, partial [Tanacetum coccineum]